MTKKNVVVWGECIYSYLALQSIINELYPSFYVSRFMSPNSIIDSDFVFFIINSRNLIESSSIFMSSDLSEKKVIVIGDVAHTKLFDVIVNRENSYIDVFLQLDDFKLRCLELMRNVRVRGCVSGRRYSYVVSPLEVEVVRMLSSGLTLSQIAKIKKKSLKTISHHKCSFFRKVGMKNNAVNLLKLPSLSYY
ncbi:hypothetical protein CRN79_03465 [Serratia fonticola]|uniref:LuxR C-terminal-related transcriptional regulator n=1 Tax=Serratia fonticola TaxID=47917 RepID=UPI000BFDFC7C|nr:LuxR C-terminal-related transcriptional regulator [Serratia fonticola]ATM74961.1 hypothetical protein CRN79_03465 [Serratia fonticola]